MSIHDLNVRYCSVLHCFALVKLVRPAFLVDHTNTRLVAPLFWGHTARPYLLMYSCFNWHTIVLHDAKVNGDWRYICETFYCNTFVCNKQLGGGGLGALVFGVKNRHSIHVFFHTKIAVKGLTLTLASMLPTAHANSASLDWHIIIFFLTSNVMILQPIMRHWLCKIVGLVPLFADVYFCFITKAFVIGSLRAILTDKFALCQWCKYGKIFTLPYSVSIRQMGSVHLEFCLIVRYSTCHWA